MGCFKCTESGEEDISNVVSAAHGKNDEGKVGVVGYLM